MLNESPFVSLTSKDYADILAIASNAPISSAEIELLTNLLAAARNKRSVTHEVSQSWLKLREKYKSFVAQDFN